MSKSSLFLSAAILIFIQIIVMLVGYIVIDDKIDKLERTDTQIIQGINQLHPRTQSPPPPPNEKVDEK